MRKIFYTALATMLVAAVAVSSAMAASATQTLDVTLSSSKKATGVKKFRAAFITKMDDGSRLPAAVGSVVSLPKGYKVNSDKFASKKMVCSPNQIKKNYLKCPKGSLLGKGTVTVDASPIFTEEITGDLYAFSGGRKKIYLMPSIVTSSGLSISGIPITGTIKKGSGDYGVLLDFTMPAFPTVPGGDDAAITAIDMSFNAVTKVGKKKYPYLTNPKTCAGTWNFRTDSVFKDGTSTYSEDSVDCS